MFVIPYIDKRWELHDDKNKGETVLEKKQFAYRIWREDFEKTQKRKDRKEAEIKDTWTEVYQLIGFDNVFQGVWFQGVTQLASQRGCRFSVLPIILSVFVSLATIVGVYLKISKLQALQKGLHKDQLCSKGLQSCINACERNGVNFDFDRIEATVTNSTRGRARGVAYEFHKELVAFRIKNIILLVSLTIASILFAWLLYTIMCGKYV